MNTEDTYLVRFPRDFPLGSLVTFGFRFLPGLLMLGS